jgi:DNA modification methylase
MTMPTPDWQSDDGKVRLYCADCMDILPQLPDGAVDAVVTDPPYGIGFKYESHDDTSEGYGKWLWAAIEQAERSARPGAACFVWQAMPNVGNFSQWFPRPYRLFAAAKNFVQMRPTAMQFSFDPVVVWWKDGEKPWSAGTATRDFHVADTRPNAPGRKPGSLGYVKGHPCPRPLLQVEHIVNQWCPPESIVLDPFLGSGTTAVACVKTGRQCIGIEKERKYFDIAVERVQRAYAEAGIFAEAAP